MQPYNRTSNSIVDATGQPLTEDATTGGSVPTSPPSTQRGAEECTNKSIRNDNGGGEVNADDNASETALEISGDSQSCQSPHNEQEGHVAKHKTTTTTIVSTETGSDMRWIYCRERGCTFWTRKPGMM